MAVKGKCVSPVVIGSARSDRPMKYISCDSNGEAVLEYCDYLDNYAGTRLSQDFKADGACTDSSEVMGVPSLRTTAKCTTESEAISTTASLTNAASTRSAAASTTSYSAAALIGFIVAALTLG